MTDKEIYNYAILLGAEISKDGNIFCGNHLLVRLFLDPEDKEYLLSWVSVKYRAPDPGYPTSFELLRDWSKENFFLPQGGSPQLQQNSLSIIPTLTITIAFEYTPLLDSVSLP